MLILYGSQSGNAEDIAKGLADDLVDAQSMSMNTFLASHPIDQLPAFSPIVFVCSTTGNGEPPDNCQKFMRKLKRLPKSNVLEGLSFALLGLGDTNYDEFCGASKSLLKQLCVRGGTVLLDPVYADEATGLEGYVEPFKSSILKLFKRKVDSAMPKQTVISHPEDIKGFPKFREASIRIRVLDSASHPSSTFPQSARWSAGIEETESFMQGYTSEAPFLSRIEKASYLTSESSEKQVIHLELDVPHENLGGMTYNVGDSIGIFCPNDVDEINVVLNRLQLSADAVIDIEGDGSIGHIRMPCSLGEALLFCVDVRSCPSKVLLRVLSEYCSDRVEKQEMLELSGKSTECKQKYLENIVLPQKSFIDLLRMYPSCKPSIEHLLTLLPDLKPRYYSIASSPAVHPGTLHIAFSIVTTPRPGLCTNWLYSVCTKLSVLPQRPNLSPLSVILGTWNRCIPIFFRRTTDFALPSDPSLPLIMIGPGTGVAPFRGFLQHREATSKALCTGGTCVGWWRGFELGIEDTEEIKESEEWEIKERCEIASSGAAWLFYGCRRRDDDFLYKQDLYRFYGNETLDRFEVAFSREAQKVYVQDLIRLQGRELCELVVEDKAVVFVCGDVSGMAKDVMDAFTDIISEHGEMSHKEARDFVIQLVKQKRYIQDIWV